MISAAYIAMETVDGDIHSQIGLSESQDSQSYKLIQEELTTILNSSSNFNSVYTWRYDRDGNLRFVVDAVPGEGSYLGDIYPEKITELEENYYTLSEPIIESGFTTDQWGITKTVYAPIITSGGEIDGVIGIDVDQSVFQFDRISFLEVLAVIIVGSIIVSIILSRIVSRTVMRPFREFVREVEKSAKTGFKTDISERDNEILSELAQTFNKAASKARKNNEDIQKEVESRTSQLEKLTNQMVGRELKMRELKKEISQLKVKKNV
jgi:methyl-accepting chemotaxis protein